MVPFERQQVPLKIKNLYRRNWQFLGKNVRFGYRDNLKYENLEDILCSIIIIRKSDRY